MPQEVSRAIDTVGNRARTELLHQLTAAGPLTTIEVAERASASRPSVMAHLLKLEAAGLVSADVLPERRHGRTVRWSVNRGEVRAVADAWARYAADE